MSDPIINIDASRRIPVARPSLGEREAKAAYDCVKSGWISQGQITEEFETVFANAHGKKYGVAVNSGTTALHLALVAAGVGPGDQVVLPTLTMVACANAVLYCGATPVFVDSDRGTGNPDPAWLEDCRIAGARTKAVLCPHLYGTPAKRFIDAARRHVPNAVLIEDCAEIHYAAIDARPVGSFGRFSCFSFYANKILASGEGGMICTNDELAADRMRSLRSHAFSPDTHFCHQELAFGVRYTDLQASVARVQFDRRAEFIARRAEIAKRYIENLRGLSWLEFPERTFESAWWVFPILMPNLAFRDRVRAVLAEAGVETRSWFVPMHKQSHLRRYATGEYPVADELSERGAYLPLYPDMSDQDVDYVAEVLRNL